MDSTGCLVCGASLEGLSPNARGERKYCGKGCRDKAGRLALIGRITEGVKPPAEKNCPACGETKAASAFYRSTRYATGLCVYCKECVNLHKVDWKARKRAENQHGAKVCASCEQSKPLVEFNPNNKTEDGYTHRCRQCISDRRHGTQSRTPREQRDLDARKAKYAKDPRFRQQAQSRSRRLYYASHEANKVVRRRWATEHPEEKKALDAKRYRVRVEWLHERKRKAGCARCGERHPACLDFHHRDQSDKIFNIGEVASSAFWTLEEIEAEIAKCDVLCSNCHRIMHWEERRGVGREVQAVLPL